VTIDPSSPVGAIFFRIPSGTSPASAVIDIRAHRHRRTPMKVHATLLSGTEEFQREDLMAFAESSFPHVNLQRMPEEAIMEQLERQSDWRRMAEMRGFDRAFLLLASMHPITRAYLRDVLRMPRIDSGTSNFAIHLTYSPLDI
jgi:hypothetical protein